LRNKLRKVKEGDRGSGYNLRKLKELTASDDSDSANFAGEASSIAADRIGRAARSHPLSSSFGKKSEAVKLFQGNNYFWPTVSVASADLS
jgi:hypothetical protein